MSLPSTHPSQAMLGFMPAPVSMSSLPVLPLNLRAASAAGVPSSDVLFNRESLARLLGVTAVTVSAWIKSGRLPVSVKDATGRPFVAWSDVADVVVGAIGAGLYQTLAQKKRRSLAGRQRMQRRA